MLISVWPPIGIMNSERCTIQSMHTHTQSYSCCKLDLAITMVNEVMHLTIEYYYKLCLLKGKCHEF